MRALALYAVLAVCVTHAHAAPHSKPRVQLSYKELLQTGTVRPLSFFLNSSDFRILHFDRDQERVYVGSRDYVLALDMDNINREPLIIHWPASLERREECRMAGKGRNDECSNFIRLIEPWNRTHLYICGTGAFNPVCGYVYRGWRSEEYIFRMVPGFTESGKGKCPFDPKDENIAALIDGNLYAGVRLDFMGTDPAIFRSSGIRPAIRSEQHDSRWLNDPIFVHAERIADSMDRSDDKLYFFFRERSLEAGSRQTHARVGRVCLNDSGGHRSLVNKWTSFLKARLLCGVRGDDVVDTLFDQLVDIFVHPTQDEKNPLIYGVFSTSGSVFRGSAVCVYKMADIRRAFKGPFAHRDGFQYQWGPYTGRVPYPRPGTCAGGVFAGRVQETSDYPADFVEFARTHPLMFHGVTPTHRRPLVMRTGGVVMVTAVAVDTVTASDGEYSVLFLGTDRGTIQKVVVLSNSVGKMEELTLEEVQVFRIPLAVRDVKISSKRQQLYVSSMAGVTQLSLHRCEGYGQDCADCCLARDPYCAWDGQHCSRYTSASAKRRTRRQDVRNGDPIRQCQGSLGKGGRRDSNRVLFGVEGSSIFLECRPRSPQASTKWLVQYRPSARWRLVRRREGVRLRGGGLQVGSLRPSDSASYRCVASENGFRRTVSRAELRVLERSRLDSPPSPPPPRTPSPHLHALCPLYTLPPPPANGTEGGEGRGGRG